MAKYVYPAVFTHEAEGGYSITFPDLPDCATSAETLEEGIEKSVRQLPERIPGANQKIQKALSIMLYAWCAAFLRDRADALMENLEKE